MFLGQAQAKPIECGLNTLAVSLYYAGFGSLADAMFRRLNDAGCYEGNGL